MRVVPVIDLMHGQVVRGVAGNRAEYQPVTSCLAAEASPAAVAAGFAGLGFREAYVADLDAIADHGPNLSAYAAIRASGLTRLNIDAGVSTTADAAALLAAESASLTQPARLMAVPDAVAADAVEAADSTHSRAQSSGPVATSVVCGLESVGSPAVLEALLELLGPDRLIFSLDLKAGRPLTDSPAWAGRAPGAIAQVALTLGVRRMIVLDLADVGTSGGTRTEGLVETILAAEPGVELWAGGGVRNLDDLLRLQSLGVSAALVASALHDGRLGPEQLAGFIAG